jgi:hypothetical protein
MELTQEWITQFNRKCAEFLGWKSTFAHEGDRYGYVQTVDGFNTPFYNDGDPQLVEMNSNINIHSISQLKFHSDWNWIMEVVNNIKQKIGNPTSVVLASFNGDINKALMKAKKEAIIQSIDQFIDWYNTQTQL